MKSIRDKVENVILILLTSISIIILTICTIGIIANNMIPKYQKIQIEQLHWVNVIVIEEYKEIKGEGFEIPLGATEESRVKRIYSYNTETGYPIYKDYYKYRYNAWEYKEDSLAEGDITEEPYWNKVNLEENEREKCRYSEYIAIDKKGKRYKTTKYIWERLSTYTDNKVMISGDMIIDII